MEKNITLTVRSKTIIEQCPLHWSSNTVDYITATFDLDEEWSECDVVKAVWSGRRSTIVTLLDANNTCTVPHEVLATVGKVNVNLTGTVYRDGEEFTRITTYPFNAITIDATAKVDGDETAPVTPSQFDQFVEAVKSETEKVTGMQAVAETLPTGSDATASYSDSVLTLGIPRGDKGDTGERGERGETGATGAKGDTGNGISSITKTGSSGLIDTYTITFTDGTSTTFNVTNGKDGSGADIDVDSALSTTSTNPVQNKVVTTALSGKANTADLATVATSGSYADLMNKPTIPTVPTNVSAFTNDAGYITSSGAPVQSVNGQTGAVTVTVPTKTSDLQNDSGFITGVAWGSVTGTLANQTDLQNALNAKQNTLTAGDNITIENNVISASGGGGSAAWTNDETVLASGTWSSETTGWTLTPTGITVGTLRKYRYILLNIKCATATSAGLRAGNGYLLQTGQTSTQPQAMIEFLDSNHKFYKWGQCFDAISSDANSKIIWESYGTLSDGYPAWRELKRCIRLGELPSTLSDSTEIFLQNNVAQTGAGVWQIRGAIEE